MKQSRLNLLADRYSIQKPLQAGGMTTVYLARDLETDALVAIKRFDRDQHLPQIEREAFSREVDALQNLSHPNIVKLLGSGEDPNGQFYLVLELMKHDLLMECQKGSQAFQGWDDFAELVILPLLAALSFAHENGIAHRDVKPANILVSADGVVKLADFGISKLKRTLQPRITLSNFMSPPFSPPEPDNGNHTYARDVYSIGVLCLWAFTKSLREFKDIHTALVDFDRPEIVEILTKATSLDPARRHQSAALLYAELNSIQSRRQSQWVVVNRTHCSLGITTLAMDVAKDELSTDDPSEIGRFLTEDMNCDSSIQRFIENFNSINERIRPDHYIVLGSTYRYHIALSNRGFDSFALINIIRSEPHFLQQDRENAAPSPIQFDIDARIGSISSNEAATIINNALEAFEAKRREQDRLNRDAALFDTWLRVLDAKLEYERSVCRPVPFIGFRIDGALVYLATKSDFEGVEIGQPRVICTDDGKFIRGDVWDICEGELV